MKYLFLVLLLGPIILESSTDQPLSEMAANERKMLANSKPDHTLESLGGTINGKDLGEWGGEVTFTTPEGFEYQLVHDNSRGIFNMPFGVIAVTGLAHLGENHGAVYAISRDGSIDRVVAVQTMKLPGWPCEAIASDSEIVLRIFRGYESLPGSADSPRYTCHALRSPYELSPQACPAGIPASCFQ